MHQVCSIAPPDPLGRHSYLYLTMPAESERLTESVHHDCLAAAWAPIWEQPNTFLGPAGTLPRNLCCKSRSHGHRASHELQLAQGSPSFRTRDQASYSLLSCR